MRRVSIRRSRHSRRLKRIGQWRGSALNSGMIKRFQKQRLQYFLGRTSAVRRSSPRRVVVRRKATRRASPPRQVTLHNPNPCHVQFPNVNYSVNGLNASDLSLSDNRLRIAMLIPVTSRKMNLGATKELEFFKKVLPSFLNSLGEDYCVYDYNFYFGCDEGDKYYDSAGRKHEFESCFRALTTNFPRVKLAQFMSLKETQSAPCYAWNQLFLKAYHDNNDYFYQIGDDCEFLTNGWTSGFINALRTHKNELGVTGPLDINNKLLMTQSFVSRTHMQVFDTYYPRFFRNWCCDEWMVYVYQDFGLCHWLKQYQVQNKRQPERYTIQHVSREELRNQVSDSKNKLLNWMNRRISFSILICSIARRWFYISRLRHLLNAQVNACATGVGEPNLKTMANQVEILIDYTPPESMSIGDKRNQLIKASGGIFVAFVDDDDLVNRNYIKKIYECLEQNPSLDCIGIRGMMYTNGTPGRPFIHSIKNKKWTEDKSFFYRPPNHLNPIRKSIAVMYPFKQLNTGEDHDFCLRIAARLKHEYMIDDTMYYYLYVTNK